MNGGSEAAEMCRRQRLYPTACAPLRSILGFSRTRDGGGPESIVSPPAAGRLARLGGADAGEAGEGRHPTSALKGKKRKDEKRRGGRSRNVGAALDCVTATRIPIGLDGKDRKYDVWLVWLADFLPRRLTRIHRPVQSVVSLPTPFVAARAGL